MLNTKNIFIATLVVIIILLTSPAHAFLGIFGDNPIEKVKNEFNEYDKSVTIGNAFEGNQYLSDFEWKTYEDKQKRTYVRFSATINLEQAKKNISHTVFQYSSIADDFKNKIQVVIELLTFANDEPSQFKAISLLINGEEYDVVRYDINNSVREEAIQQIFANQMPFEGAILILLTDRFLLKTIKAEINKSEQNFYPINFISNFVKKNSSNIELVKAGKFWFDLGLDSSETYFKIHQINDDSIKVSLSLFLSKVTRYGGNLPPKYENFKTLTLNEVILHISSTSIDTTSGTYGLTLTIEDNLKLHIKNNMHGTKGLFVSTSGHIINDGIYLHAENNIFVLGEDAKISAELEKQSYLMNIFQQKVYAYEEQGSMGDLVFKENPKSPGQYFVNISTASNYNQNSCMFEGICSLVGNDIICYDKYDKNSFITLQKNMDNINIIGDDSICGVGVTMSGNYAPCVNKTLATKQAIGIVRGVINQASLPDSIEVILENGEKISEYMSDGKNKKYMRFDFHNGEKANIVYDIIQSFDEKNLSCNVTSVVRSIERIN